MTVYLSKQQLLSVMFANSKYLPILVHARLSVAANQQGALLLTQGRAFSHTKLWHPNLQVLRP